MLSYGIIIKVKVFFVNNIMSIYAGVGNMMAIQALSSILSIAFSTLLMLAVGFDCKAKNNDKKTMWMVLTFFFPIIAGIVYACTRNKSSVPQMMNCPNCGAYLDSSMQYCPNCNNTYFPAMDGAKAEAAKNSKNSKICFGVSVGVYVVSVILSIIMLSSVIPQMLNIIDDNFDNAIDGIEDSFDYDYNYDDSYLHYGFDVNGKTVYYDRNGNSYSDADDVVYYDRDGNTYTYDEDSYQFETPSEIEYNSLYCYVDREGYFVFDKAGAFLGEPSILDTDNYMVFRDKKGNIYYYADSVSWDADGNMIDNYGDALPTIK